MRAKDFVGFGELAFGGVPVFALSIGFLYSDDVVIMDKFFESSFFGFSPLFGEAIGCE